MSRKERLHPGTFRIDVAEIRYAYNSAVYFKRHKDILEGMGYTSRVLAQTFQKNDAIFCGMDEAAAILKICTGSWRDQAKVDKLFLRLRVAKRELSDASFARDYARIERLGRDVLHIEMEMDRYWEDAFSEVSAKALYDGEVIKPWEAVMTIEGNPRHFVHLESVFLGVLARRTRVATNVARVVKAANGKQVLFFADRFDHYSNQTGDGYAAWVGGIARVATNSMGEWWGSAGVGTIPHGLIACFSGNTEEATLAFARKYPDVPCISLVDYDNDCPATALRVAECFKAEGLPLYGVRLDTSEMNVDASIVRNKQMGDAKPTGVNPMVVGNTRSLLDRNGHDYLKLVVSGGFNEEKIRYFERIDVPVDAYGCGEVLLEGTNAFTNDIVLKDGAPCAKQGRWYRPNDKLEPVH